MTKIKFCGLKTLDDIQAVNKLLPEYVGFVFAPKSKRYVTPAQARQLRNALDKKISAVGVFVDENLSTVAELLNNGTIDAAQLHGNETDDYIKNLRGLTNKPIIKAFQAENIAAAESSVADFVLIDSGAGGGKVFDWSLINLRREYFLAGGLTVENVGSAIELLHPFAVDVSSGIETDGRKDFSKMAAFVKAVRNKEQGTRNKGFELVPCS